MADGVGLGGFGVGLDRDGVGLGWAVGLMLEVGGALPQATASRTATIACPWSQLRPFISQETAGQSDRYCRSAEINDALSGIAHTNAFCARTQRGRVHTTGGVAGSGRREQRQLERAALSQGARFQRHVTA